MHCSWISNFIIAAGSVTSSWPQFGGNAQHTGQSSYALNDTLHFIWSYTTGNNIWSSAAIGLDGTVYVGSLDNNLYALNGTTGTLKWFYTANGNVYTSPSIASDGTIYFTSFGNTVYSLNANGTLRCSCSIGHNVWSSPTRFGTRYKLNCISKV